MEHDPTLVDLDVKFGRVGRKGMHRDTWVRSDEGLAQVVRPDGHGGWEVRATLAVTEVWVSCDRWVYVGFKPAGNGLIEEWHCLHPPVSAAAAQNPW